MTKKVKKAIIIFLTLLALILVTLILLSMFRKKEKSSKQDTTDTRNTDNNQNNVTNKLYQEIMDHEISLNLPFYSSQDPTLDRYSNVKPYANNRCLLPSKKYINASPLDYPHHPVRFILAQSPPKKCLEEFYELLTSWKVVLIVRVGGEKHYEKYVREVLKLEVIDFDDWPDHGVPSREKFDQLYDSYHKWVEEWRRKNISKRPTVLVHCQAGVGRTGTFVAFDIARRKEERNEKINIVSIIKEMRHYRTLLVQTPSQLQFLLDYYPF